MADLFNEKSKSWDSDVTVKTLSSAIGSLILEQVPLNAQMEVMDFGAGTGLISSYVAPLVNKIVAVDISEAMLDKLVSKPELDGKVEAVCQDILKTPFDGRFDLIMSAMAIHHIEDTAKLIQSFSEHLKEGAMIALADLDKEDGSFHPEGTEGVFHYGFNRDVFEEMLINNGFEDIQFFTAYTVTKAENKFPVFLVVAKKVNKNQAING